MASIKRFGWLMLVMLMPIGCVSRDIKSAKTGILKDDPELLLATYSKIKSGVTTQENLEKAGFNFRAPNVLSLVGQDAFEYLFGPSFARVRDAFISKQSKENTEMFVTAIKEFRLYIIPYKDILKIKDRFWWSTKNETQTGQQLAIFLMFNKDNVVVYRGLNFKRINIQERSSGFLHGILRFVFMGDPEEAFDEVVNSNREDEEGLGLGLLGNKDKKKDKKD